MNKDMDGVLIDAMPFHAEAMRLAIKEETKHDINKKSVYLLEGLPGSKLVKEIFKRENIDENVDDNLAERIGKRKKEIFKEIQSSKPIEGARELINDLKSCSCLKAVVSGSSKEEIETVLENIGSNNFDFVISGDDLKKGQGKPDPAPFQTALQRMNLTPSEAIVVENSPLGIEAAKKAGISYIVTLNNTPLEISSDFGSLLEEDKLNNRIFKDTKAARNFLKDWCCK
ncbi:MAG: HAD family phosphatase [Candidatus Nitrosopolaris sp.]